MSRAEEPSSVVHDVEKPGEEPVPVQSRRVQPPRHNKGVLVLAGVLVVAAVATTVAVVVHNNKDRSDSLDYEVVSVWNVTLARYDTCEAVVAAFRPRCPMAVADYYFVQHDVDDTRQRAESFEMQFNDAWCDLYGNYQIAMDDVMEDAPAAGGAEGGTGGSNDGGSNGGSGGSGSGGDFSTTNNQEEGVDESDILKTDSRGLVYTLTRVITPQSNDGASASDYYYYTTPTTCVATLTVTQASSADGSLTVVASLPLTPLNIVPAEMFVDDDAHTVLVLGTASLRNSDDYLAGAVALLVDVSDPASPVVVRRVVVQGTFVTARKIGSTAYVVTTRYDYFASPGTVPVMADSAHDAQGGVDATTLRFKPLGSCSDVLFVEGAPMFRSHFTTVLAVSMADASAEIATSTVALGAWSAVYATQTALYITQAENSMPCDAIVTDSTFVVRLTLSPTAITPSHVFSVPGRILNQFSMSEVDGAFRVATTTGWWWWVDNTGPSSGLYVHDVSDRTAVPAADDNGSNDDGWDAESLVAGLAYHAPLLGKVDGIAPGETIKSARFDGDRCYLVTFVQTDPLFVIDTADNKHPRVLGELKVPGFSTYLHPLAPGRLLGLGRDAYTTRWGWTRERGFKLSLFDVADELNPVELDSVVLSGTSEATYEHKAFQFWPGMGPEGSLGVVAVPVQRARRTEDPSEGEGGWYDGDPFFQGLVLFAVSDSSVSLLANVTHHATDAFDPVEVTTASGYTYTTSPWWDTLHMAFDVVRALRRDDEVFSLSNNALHVSRLVDGRVLLPVDSVEF